MILMIGMKTVTYQDVTTRDEYESCNDHPDENSNEMIEEDSNSPLLHDDINDSPSTTVHATTENDTNLKCDTSKVDILMERVGRPKSKKSAIKRCKRRYRNHSIQRDKEIESFMFFLDKKYKQIKDADKQKDFASSPDKTCSPEAKCPKVS